MADEDMFACFGDDELPASAPQSTFSAVLRAKLIVAEKEYLSGCMEDLGAPEASRSLKEAFSAVASQDGPACIRHGGAAHGAADTRLRDGWPHVAWRELYCLGALCAAAGYHATGQSKDAMQMTDMAAILGAPTPLVRAFVTEIEPRIERALSAGPVLSFDRPPLRNDELAPAKGKATPMSGVLHLDLKWPAFDRWRDLGYLRQQLGHRWVPVELGVGEMRESMMSFGAFLDTHLLPRLAGDKADVAYVAQHCLFDHVFSLAADFTCPPTPDHVEKVNAWIGTDGTVTPLHFDSYDNYFVQVVGYKFVRTYASSETKYLYVSDGVGGRSSLHAQGNVSSVRLEGGNFDEFPLLAEATYSEVILGPGEALHIPAGVWHFVRSLTPSISVNFWF